VAAAAALVGVLVVRDVGGSGGDPSTASSASHNGSGGAGAPADQPTGTPPVSLETRVIDATEAAVASSVVKVTQVDASGNIGDSVMWTDEQSGMFRSLQKDVAGENSFDSGPAHPPTADAQAPDYPEGADIRLDDPNLPQTLTRTIDYCFGEYTEADEPAMPGGGWTTTIRQQIDAGELVADGTQMFEGRELLKFQEVIPDEPELTDLAWVLVDPETYRPVHRVGYPGSDTEYTMTIEFLPRTPENLAQLEAPVPAGFTEVEQLHGDGERLDHGCTY
jgi:hypothetical protein